jgi:hypothetical protein
LILICTCWVYQNLRRVQNIKEMSDCLICRGFIMWYTQCVWHEENINNIKNIIQDELRGDYVEDLNLGNDERVYRRMKI